VDIEMKKALDMIVRRKKVRNRSGEEFEDLMAARGASQIRCRS
jgi:hypothetical protein